MKCFLVFYTLEKQKLISLWMKILDPKGVRHLPKANLEIFLELVARGITTEEHTLVSREYSNHVLELF